MERYQKYESVLLEGELASAGLVSGTFFLHPRGCYIWDQIRIFLDLEFEKLGCKNVLFPGLIPFSEFQKEEHRLNSFNPEELMWIGSRDEKYSFTFLRPTSELLFSHFFSTKLKERTQSLPLILNQWSSVYRQERNLKLFFRSREFYWQELHAIFKYEGDAFKYLYMIHGIYLKLLRKLLCLESLSGEKTVLERFIGAEKTLTHECILPDGQSLQVATTHYLGHFFSSLYSMKYWINNENWIEPIQLSAGTSTRLIGAIVELHRDNTGIILPWNLSREKISIILLNNIENYDESDHCREMQNVLSKYNLRWDTSEGSIGKKIYKSEKLGIPISIIVGQNEINEWKVVIKFRLLDEKYSYDLSGLETEIERLRSMYDSELLLRSRQKLDDLIVEAYRWDELVELISEGKIVLSPWLNTRENEIEFQKTKHNFTPRCIFKKFELDHSLRCVFSGKPSNSLVYFGRSY